MKPITFNTEMVRAILDGRKTVTRRVVKPQPGEELAYIWGGSNHGKWGYSPYNEARYEEHRTAGDWKYWAPPCHADDILYVRETWAAWSRTEGIPPTIHYRADGENLPNVKWRPSIHMPREAARIFLRVTDVRVGRLQEISINAAKAEGVGRLFIDEIRYGHKEYGCMGTDKGEDYGRAREQFAYLWDSTIKPADRERYGWAADPWVWVIAFERCKKLKEG